MTPTHGQRPRWALLAAQTTIGLREMPQMAFLLLFLQYRALGPSQIAQVVSAAQVAGMAVAFFGGVLTQRLGSKWVYVLGLVLSIAGSVAFALESVWWITIAWVIGGAGAALYNVGGSGYLTRIGQTGGFGTLTALYILSSTVGGALGHPIASQIITGWSYPTYGAAMIALVCVTILFASSTMPDLRDAAATADQPRRGLGSLLRSRMVWSIIALRSAATVHYGAMLLMVPLLLNERTHDAQLVAWYGSATLVVASLAQFAAGRAADRWGARWPTALSFGVMVAGGLFLAVSYTSVTALFVGGVVSIAAAWALATLMFVWVADGVPQHDHASLFGLLYAVWSVSMIGGSLSAGRLMEYNPALAFAFVGGVNVLALLVGKRMYKIRN